VEEDVRKWQRLSEGARAIAYEQERESMHEKIKDSAKSRRGGGRGRGRGSGGRGRGAGGGGRGGGVKEREPVIKKRPKPEYLTPLDCSAVTQQSRAQACEREREIEKKFIDNQIGD
jgi:hypothetical protein